MSTRFRGGAQSGSHRSVSTPCPPNRDVRISRIRLSSGIMHLARGTPVRSHTRGTGGFACPRLPEAARLHPRCPSLQRAVRPVRALTAPSLHLSPAPSLTHVMLWDSPPLHAGFVGKATPAGFRPSVIPPHLRPLSSTGITPRLQYYGPLRHPVGPACPSRGSGCPRARHRQGFPCCYAFHLPCMPTPLPRRKPAGALVALFPAGRRPSPVSRRVDFRNNRFEACSAFTRVPACMVAEPPKAALLSRELQSMSLPP